jgi:hypothetical protein
MRSKLHITTDRTHVDLYIDGSRLAGIMQNLICAARPIGSKSFDLDGVRYTVHISDDPAVVTGRNQHIEIDHVIDPLANEAVGATW